MSAPVARSPKRRGGTGLPGTATTGSSSFPITVVVGNSDPLACKRGNCARIPTPCAIVIAFHPRADHPVIRASILRTDCLSIAVIVPDRHRSSSCQLDDSRKPITRPLIVAEHPVAGRLRRCAAGSERHSPRSQQNGTSLIYSLTSVRTRKLKAPDARRLGRGNPPRAMRDADALSRIERGSRIVNASLTSSPANRAPYRRSTDASS